MWRGHSCLYPWAPAGPQNSMKTLAPATWRRPRPDSSGRFSGVYSASGGEGVFEAVRARAYWVTVSMFVKSSHSS